MHYSILKYKNVSYPGSNFLWSFQDILIFLLFFFLLLLVT